MKSTGTALTVAMTRFCVFGIVPFFSAFFFPGEQHEVHRSLVQSAGLFVFGLAAYKELVSSSEL